MKGYIVIIIILSLISVYSTTRFLLLENEIRKLNKYLEKILKSKSDITEDYKNAADVEDARIITCTIGDRNYENLVKNINKYIKNKRVERITFFNREQEFKMEIANISHDLRTPLTTILGYMDLIKESLRDEQIRIEDNVKKKDIILGKEDTRENNNISESQRVEAIEHTKSDIWSYIDIVERRSKNLQNLIEQFYEYSRLNDINYVIELTKVNITQIVSEHLLSYYQDFENRGIEVHVDIEDRPIWVSGSENTIGRIVNNLTGNALKYAIDGLKVKVYEDDNYAYIEYSNRTECMTEYDIKHIFDRFFMTDKSRNKSSSGLGLTISRLLADKMGGEVYAEYEEPWFIITVKLKKWDSD